MMIHTQLAAKFYELWRIIRKQFLKIRNIRSEEMPNVTLNFRGLARSLLLGAEVVGSLIVT